MFKHPVGCLLDFNVWCAGTSLCSLSQADRIPKFFRVTERDLPHFPRDSFASLSLDSVEAAGPSTLNITCSISLEFYYNEYDWGLIYRSVAIIIKYLRN